MKQLLMGELAIYAMWAFNLIVLVAFFWMIWREHRHKDGD